MAHFGHRKSRVAGRDSRAAGHRIRCPLLDLWGSQSKTGAWYDQLAIWRRCADADVTGHAVSSNHDLAQESTAEALTNFRAFLG